jgi:protein SCO1
VTPAIRRRALLVSLLVLAGVLAYALGVVLRPAPALAGTALQNPPRVAQVELVRGDGAPVTLAEVGAGGSLLVFFGFTRCPDVCPITMAHLARVFQDLGEPDGLTVAMITVDPEHDTPEVLDRYVRAFHPDFVSLTGSNAQIAVAARTFFVGYAGIGTATFTHTDVVALVDRAGDLRYVYNQEALRRLAPDLEQILRQRGF